MHVHQGHGHDHPRGLPRSGAGVERSLWIALWINAAFLGVELTAGLLSDSLALLSDAGHMASDVAALGLAFAAQRLARAQVGPHFTFGLRRVPVLGAFGNAVSLIVIAVLILWEAYHRWQAPPPVAGWPVLGVGLLGLIINLVAAWVLYRSRDRGLNVRGAMLHLLADALGSVGAVAAGLIILLTGWLAADTLISALIAVLLLASTWPLLRDSTKVLLQSAPPGVDLKALSELLQQAPEVQAVADLHVWAIDLGQVVMTANLVTCQGDLAVLEAAAARLKQQLQDEWDIRHATFEWCTSVDKGDGCTMR